jgi:tetratricopeptide (TPR) repeat protein
LDDVDGKINPDIWYSRAELHHFLENYAAALVDYREAIRLDPTMMTTNRPPVDEICTYLGKMDELIHKRANLKPKKFQSCISSLSKPVPNPVIFQHQKTNTQVPFMLIPFAAAKVSAVDRDNVNVGKAVRIKLLGEIKSRFIHR